MRSAQRAGGQDAVGFDVPQTEDDTHKHLVICSVHLAHNDQPRYCSLEGGLFPSGSFIFLAQRGMNDRSEYPRVYTRSRKPLLMGCTQQQDSRKPGVTAAQHRRPRGACVPGWATAHIWEPTTTSTKAPCIDLTVTAQWRTLVGRATDMTLAPGSAMRRRSPRACSLLEERWRMAG